jgi:hypothetical protein
MVAHGMDRRGPRTATEMRTLASDLWSGDDFYEAALE